MLIIRRMYLCKLFRVSSLSLYPFTFTGRGDSRRYREICDFLSEGLKAEQQECGCLSSSERTIGTELESARDMSVRGSQILSIVYVGYARD